MPGGVGGQARAGRHASLFDTQRWLVLLAITVLPIARTVAESFLVRDRPGGPATVSFERYRELFAGTPAATE